MILQIWKDCWARHPYRCEANFDDFHKWKKNNRISPKKQKIPPIKLNGSSWHLRYLPFLRRCCQKSWWGVVAQWKKKNRCLMMSTDNFAVFYFQIIIKIIGGFVTSNCLFVVSVAQTSLAIACSLSQKKGCKPNNETNLRSFKSNQSIHHQLILKNKQRKQLIINFSHFVAIFFGSVCSSSIFLKRKKNSFIEKQIKLQK